MILQKGDLVRHKNLPTERLMIKKIYDTIATCERLDEEKIWGMQVNEYIYQVYICNLDSLQHDNQPSVSGTPKELGGTRQSIQGQISFL
jgi:hypothetical protein